MLDRTFSEFGYATGEIVGCDVRKHLPKKMNMDGED
jgi:hypothetical protein